MELTITVLVGVDRKSWADMGKQLPISVVVIKRFRSLHHSK